jgi:deoxycytidylate deaminase
LCKNFFQLFFTVGFHQHLKPLSASSSVAARRQTAANFPLHIFRWQLSAESRYAMAMSAQFMRVALRLARRGYGATSPNPMVGAVLVKGGKIIGRGWHQDAGGF